MAPSGDNEASNTGSTGGIFTQVANEILDSAEKLSNRLEDGLNAILSGGDVSGGSNGEQAAPHDNAVDNEALKADAKEFLKEAMEESGEEIDWDSLDMDADSPLSGIAESVMGDIMQGQAGPQSMWDHLDAFRHAITWSEPFIVGLLVFQVALFGLTCYVSRKGVGLAPRIVLMLFIAGLVRSAEWLNAWAGRNWQDYTTQNYFDPRGIFVSIFLCAPLLLDSFIMLIFFLREASQLLVQVKTAELKQKRKKAKASATSEGSGGKNNKQQQRRGKKDQ